jgi:hypothetical protein
MIDPTKFQWDLSQDVEISQCVYCRHWIPGGTCAAFPEGIPQAILENEIDHREPVLGDHGVRFAPRTPDGILRVDQLFADHESRNGDPLSLDSRESSPRLQRGD